MGVVALGGGGVGGGMLARPVPCAASRVATQAPLWKGMSPSVSQWGCLSGLLARGAAWLGKALSLVLVRAARAFSKWGEGVSVS